MLLLTVFTENVRADTPALTVDLIKAPEVSSLKILSEKSMGLWDDIFVPDDDEFLIVRKGENLYQLSLPGDSEPVLLAASPELKNTRIMTGTRTKDKLWIFLQSFESNPLAFEIFSKKLVNFEIPGVSVPGQQTATIQSWIFAPHRSGALLMIAGGDQATWPRDGNRPVYVWINLLSGATIQIPIGWDLDYFSSDQSIAAFTEPYNKELNTKPFTGLNMNTGQYLHDVPGKYTDEFVAFDWTNTARAKPLLSHRFPETGDMDRLIGISDQGETYPLQFRIESPYRPNVKTNAQTGLIHIYGYGNPRVESNSLWITPLKENSQPILIARDVQQYEILSREACLWSAEGFGHSGKSQEAFVYDIKNNTAWNVLDGIERLAELPESLKEKDYIQDQMKINLISDFGSKKEMSMSLALFTHAQRDMRAFAWPTADEPVFKNQTWYNAVLLTNRLDHYEIRGFQLWNDADQIWLHNSGTVILGQYVWADNINQSRQINLTKIIISDPQ
ncbi:MAG: hypothetical protein AB7S78_01440 [Candidatus Omnitrophota bacterium]